MVSFEGVLEKTKDEAKYLLRLKFRAGSKKSKNYLKIISNYMIMLQTSVENTVFTKEIQISTKTSFKNFEQETFPDLPVSVIKKWCVFARKKPDRMHGVKALFTMGV